MSIDTEYCGFGACRYFCASGSEGRIEWAYFCDGRISGWSAARSTVGRTVYDRIDGPTARAIGYSP